MPSSIKEIDKNIKRVITNCSFDSIIQVGNVQIIKDYELNFPMMCITTTSPIKIRLQARTVVGPLQFNTYYDVKDRQIIRVNLHLETGSLIGVELQNFLLTVRFPSA